ncbi:MAG: AAA family ATPase, partial [Bacteroidota bacterium]|nr:AAA family ATPase [Bacteroidota bacterium]
LNAKIESFIRYYLFAGFDLPPVNINYDNALFSIESLLSAVKTTPYPIYLLIDEYDNFANTLMMGESGSTGNERYETIVHDEGILRTLFKAIKASTSGSMFDRVFITGVSPVVLSDITSGYNIAENIYSKPGFNDLCGFRENEVRDVIEQLVTECNFEPEKIPEKIDDARNLMKTYYNGYLFAVGLDEYLYNPTLCLYFFKQFQETCDYPRKMLDSNLAVDESKLEYIANIPKGREILLLMMEKEYYLTAEDISDRFGVREMLSDNSKNNIFLVSFLYYFGVLTLAGETDDLKIKLKVPNLVIQGLYVERVQKMLLPDPGTRDDGRLAAEKVYQKGNMEPLRDFVENRYFSVFKNRDYRWANELTLKTAFLTLLYNDIIFIMDSEPEISRKYADLTMIIRPDKRYGKIFDVLIEFKFITLKEAGLTGAEAKQLATDKLHNLPQVKKAFTEGRQQVALYAKALDNKYGNLRLQKFVVTALGFERVCFEKVD